jgi:hypothetical protein
MGVDKIVKLVGVLVAVVAGLIGGFPQSALVIAVLGLVGGYFIAEDDRMRFLVATVALLAVQGTLSGIPVVGGYITGALGGLAALFSAAAVTAIVMGIINAVKP